MWCKNKKSKIEVKQPEQSLESRTNPVFAFLVGHNESSQGAVNYLGETEWAFNSRIARKAQLKLADYGQPSVIIFRPSNQSYKYQVQHVIAKAVELGIEFCFSLHFNSYLKPAYGCEVLITDEAHMDSITIADFITDQLNDKFGIVQRHEQGIKTIYQGHNGYEMLHGLEQAGIKPCLVEPCFANHRTKESQAFFENEDLYAQILADAAEKLLKS